MFIELLDNPIIAMARVITGKKSSIERTRQKIKMCQILLIKPLRLFNLI